MEFFNQAIDILKILVMALGAGVVVAVTLQQIDRTPNAEASAQRHNEGLKNTNSRIKESHK